ncbi:MAG: tRNA isopentenyltransferase [Treponematales bacterium]
MERNSGVPEEAAGGGAVPVLALFGPTASGKTALLRLLFAGGLWRGTQNGLWAQAEVVSADSMQVYRGMDLGTAKPGREERAALPHHLIDIRSPAEQFTVGDFVREAEACCRNIAWRGRLPVVSGGAGFYLKNLIQGMSEAPPSDPRVRAEVREDLTRRGPEALAEELARRDPVSAGRIHPRDTYRLTRALEVARLTGRPLSSFAAGGKRRRGFRFLAVGIRRGREELYRRINARCAAMFRSGLPEEARRLFEAGFTPECPGMKAIGYREFFIDDGSGGWALARDMSAVETLAARNSRRYAKRQMTFFASLPEVRWIDIGGGEEAELAGARAICQALEEFLGAGE